MRRKVLVSLLVLGLVLTLFVSCASLGSKKDVLAGRWNTTPFDGEEGTMTLDIDGRGSFSVHYDDTFAYKGSYKINGDIVLFVPDLQSMSSNDGFNAYVFLGDPENPATTPYTGGKRLGMCYFVESEIRPTDNEMYYIFDISEGKYLKEDEVIVEFTDDSKFVLSAHFLVKEDDKTVCDGILYDVADRTDNPEYELGSMQWYCKINNLHTKEAFVNTTFPIQDDKLKLWFFFKDYGVVPCEFTKQSE